MIAEIFKISDLSKDRESQMIVLKVDANPGFAFDYIPESIGIEWNGVEGILDGELQLLACMNTVSHTELMKVPINSSSNLNDALIILLAIPLDNLRIIYKANGIEQGKLRVFVSYARRR